jgi:hypothetical protein
MSTSEQEQERLHTMWVTLFGATGGNGLQGDQKEMMKRIRKLEIGQARIAVVAGLASGIISGGVLLLAKTLLGG